MNIIRKTIFFTVIFLLCLIRNSFAQFSLIRDAETEKFLREISNPVLIAAGFNPSDISIYIVNDSSLNAFVTGGQNIFINTGLIRKYKTPDALIGVIAHEAGHISGGHIARSSEEMKSASNSLLLSYLLGIGAVIAGSPEAAQGIIMGGNNIAQKLYLKYNRGQEESADRYAVEYLKKIEYPADGLIKLLEYFDMQMRGYKGFINEYAMSHPISQKRIDYLKNNAQYQSSDKKINYRVQPLMNRVVAKLEAFIDEPYYLLKKYLNKNDENSRYVKAIAYFRIGKIEESLKILDQIISKNKSDGFLYELKGQILFESGRVEESVIFYQKAIKNLKNIDSNQARISLASSILALKTDDKTLNQIAIKNLKIASKFEKNNPFLYKNLAKSYYKIDDFARSYANFAEYNYLIGDIKKAKKYSQKAKKEFDKVSDKESIKTDLLRLEDLIELFNIKDNNQEK